MSKPRAYLAGPLGFTAAGRHYLSEVYLPALSQIIEPIDPWSLTDPAEVTRASADGTLPEFWLDIGRRNRTAIDSADLLIADLDGQEIDSGTAAELGYGAGRGLTCFGLRSDLREHGENGMAVNLQLVAFIADSGGRLVTSLDELLSSVGSWVDARS